MLSSAASLSFADILRNILVLVVLLTLYCSMVFACVYARFLDNVAKRKLTPVDEAIERAAQLRVAMHIKSSDGRGGSGSNASGNGKWPTFPSLSSSSSGGAESAWAAEVSSTSKLKKLLRKPTVKSELDLVITHQRLRRQQKGGADKAEGGDEEAYRGTSKKEDPLKEELKEDLELWGELQRFVATKASPKWMSRSGIHPKSCNLMLCIHLFIHLMSAACRALSTRTMASTRTL